jgi:hypothetical protein
MLRPLALGITAGDFALAAGPFRIAISLLVGTSMSVLSPVLVTK